MFDVSPAGERLGRTQDDAQNDRRVEIGDQRSPRSSSRYSRMSRSVFSGGGRTSSRIDRIARVKAKSFVNADAGSSEIASGPPSADEISATTAPPSISRNLT